MKNVVQPIILFGIFFANRIAKIHVTIFTQWLCNARESAWYEDIFVLSNV